MRPFFALFELPGKDLYKLQSDTTDNLAPYPLKRSQVQNQTVPQPSETGSQRRVIGHAVWIGGMAYSLTPVNHSNTS